MRHLLVVAACVIGSACTHHISSTPSVQTCVVDVLYFGRNIASAARSDSAVVSSSEWRAFVDDAFRRWIPSGSTESDAAGRYVAGTAWVTESTKVVTIVHRDAPAPNAGIDSTITLYTRRFKQQSVGRVQSKAASTLCESEQPT